MNKVFTSLLSKIIAAVGGLGALAILFVDPAQKAVADFIAANPKYAPIAAFLALVFAAFAPSAKSSNN